MRMFMVLLIVFGFAVSGFAQGELLESPVVVVETSIWSGIALAAVVMFLVGTLAVVFSNHLNKRVEADNQFLLAVQNSMRDFNKNFVVTMQSTLGELAKSAAKTPTPFDDAAIAALVRALEIYASNIDDGINDAPSNEDKTDEEIVVSE